MSKHAKLYANKLESFQNAAKKTLKRNFLSLIFIYLFIFFFFLRGDEKLFPFSCFCYMENSEILCPSEIDWKFLVPNFNIMLNISVSFRSNASFVIKNSTIKLLTSIPTLKNVYKIFPACLRHFSCFPFPTIKSRKIALKNATKIVKCLSHFH